jgi:hypothetical protein
MFTIPPDEAREFEVPVFLEIIRLPEPPSPWPEATVVGYCSKTHGPDPLILVGQAGFAYRFVPAPKPTEEEYNAEV